MFGVLLANRGVDMEERDFWRNWTPRVLSLVRIVFALLFIEHGSQKVFGMPPMAGGAGPVPAASLMGAAGIIELIGGSLLLVGLLTRFVAFVMSGEMAVAYFMVHAPHSPFPVVNQGEPAVLFCFIFLYYFFAGAGSWSLDALIWRPKSRPVSGWPNRVGPTTQPGT